MGNKKRGIDRVTRKRGDKQTNSMKTLLKNISGVSKELDTLVVDPPVVGNNGRLTIVKGSLPKDVLKQLKALGFDVVEREPENKEETVKTQLPTVALAVKTARVEVMSNSIDPSLMGIKPNEESVRNLLAMANGRNKSPNTMETFREPVKTGRENPNGWIGDISFTGTSAVCNIYYYTNEQKEKLQKMAELSCNNFLNNKSFVRKEANRDFQRDGMAKQQEGKRTTSRERELGMLL
ncbi:hypothetical protein FACS1894152_0260 [Bacilli bacterium]|nr:hypothetical protein FACS1894152_0260 [Bacilli bacterium]